ncbi:hypothetical protein UlMin_001159 [Ulmus minor]
MTLEEKIGQMLQIEHRAATLELLRDFAIDNSLSHSSRSEATIEISTDWMSSLSSDWANMIDGFQELVLQSLLGIPIIYGDDVVHGNNNVYGATIFPHNLDADLAQKIGTVTALEVRASGAHYTFAPCVSRDPRWGRCYESYSKDIAIVRKMTSIVSGLQGQPPQGHQNGYPFVAGRNKVIACAKHFVGDGGTEKGVNEGNTICSYEDLESIHMAPYLDCLSQGVSTVMASYSGWNGSRLHPHKDLAREAVRKSLVLLKNGKDPQKPLLPLDRNAKRILATGSHADDLGFQCGGWTSTWDGCSGRITIGTTILEAIKEAVVDDAEVIYEQYPSAETLALQDISFAIVVVGESPYAEFTGDNSKLTIPFNGPYVISSVADRFPTLNHCFWKIDALVAAWLPGSEGGSIVDVIFGDFDFDGKLPVTASYLYILSTLD